MDDDQPIVSLASSNNTECDMWRSVKILFVLLLLAFAGVVGFAFFGDISAPPEQITKPVEIGKT